MSNISLGWAGLGNMGKRISRNLLKAGYSLSVFNRTKEKEKELIDAGASSAENLKKLARQCDIIFTMVSDDEAVKEMYTDEQGLLSSDGKMRLAIDMSTVSPSTSRY